MPHVPSPSALSLRALAGALALLVTAAVAPLALAADAAQGTAPSSAAAETTRVSLPSFDESDPFPYTIEIPADWGPRRDLPIPGALLGPPSGTPDSFPEMLLIHPSKVVVSDPEAILANVQAAAKKGSWTLEEGEVEDFGGTRGLWIVRRLPASGSHGERVNFAVKLPMPEGSLDVTATLPVERLDELRPKVETMLHSIRPAQAKPAGKTTPDSGGASSS